MKTVERIDFPVIVTRDGNAADRHERADIVFTHGAPAYVRAQEPFAIYPWEVVRQINRTSDEVGTWLGTGDKVDESTYRFADLASVRQGGSVEGLQAARVALGKELATMHGFVSSVCKAFDAHIDDLSGETLSKFAANLGQAYRDDARKIRSLEADFASVTEQRDVLKRQLEEMRADLASQYPNRDKPPPGFDVGRLPKNLRMTVETAGVWGPNALAEAWRLHEEERNPGLPQPKQVEPGGPIWVRVVDTSSRYFGLVGRLVGIEHHTTKGECWGIDFPDLDGKDHAWRSVRTAWNRAEAFAVIGTGRQGPGPNEAPKPDTEHQQAQNRDKWRATCLANGAKDCTVYFGPGDEITFVVEMNPSCHLSRIQMALRQVHGLHPDQFTIREVRPIVDGVKPSAFKHPADNGQP